jgi:hypothetical protein
MRNRANGSRIDDIELQVMTAFCHLAERCDSRKEQDTMISNVASLILAIYAAGAYDRAGLEGPQAQLGEGIPRCPS